MIYPLVRRFTRRAGLYISSRGGSQSYPGYPGYPLSDADADTGGGGGGGGGGYSKRRKFRHPLSIPDTQWNTISDEQMILPTSRQQPPTCTAGDGDWDSRSQGSQGGIKVVHETIIHSTEKSQL